MPDAFDFLGDAVTTDKGDITDYPVAIGEYVGANLEASIDSFPLAYAGRQMRYLNEDMASLAGANNRVDQKTAEEEVRGRGLDLKIPAGGMTRYELDTLQYLKQREIRQRTTFDRPHSAIAGAAGFVAGAAVGVLDPINVASSFIPFVPEARYAAWLARAGTSTFARAAVRAGVGAIEGAGGAALIEPLIYEGATSEQRDYGLMDSFLNVTMGSVLGGGLHPAGGAIYDYRAARALRGLDKGIQGNDFFHSAPSNVPEHVQREALHVMVDALERGETADVQPMFERALGEARAGAEKEITALKSELETVRDDAARVGEIEAKIEAVKAAAPAPDAQATFTTAKGSVYQVHADGTTTRNKAYRPEHGFDEQGQQATSDVTVYLTADQASALATPESNWRMFRHDDGTVSLISKNKNGEWGISPTAKNIPVATSPQKGLLPLEFWHTDATVAGKRGVAYKRVHFGNKIVDVLDAPKAPPRDLAGLIEQSKADRTQAAFDRQFTDQADPVLETERAKPKDHIERAKADEDTANEIVEEFRKEGRLTEEDEAGVKLVDEAVKRAELKAKAFEAAAACMVAG